MSIKFNIYFNNVPTIANLDELMKKLGFKIDQQYNIPKQNYRSYLFSNVGKYCEADVLFRYHENPEHFDFDSKRKHYFSHGILETCNRDIEMPWYKEGTLEKVTVTDYEFYLNYECGKFKWYDTAVQLMVHSGAKPVYLDTGKIIKPYEQKIINISTNKFKF